MRDGLTCYVTEPLQMDQTLIAQKVSEQVIQQQPDWVDLISYGPGTFLTNLPENSTNLFPS